MSESKKLLVPMIHMNGTSKESLLEDIENAYVALGEAFDKLRQCVPNGRDYYPLGPGVVYQAQEQHHARLRAIESVRKELTAIAEGIHDSATEVEIEV